MRRAPLLIAVIVLAAALLGAGWWLGRRETSAAVPLPAAGGAQAETDTDAVQGALPAAAAATASTETKAAEAVSLPGAAALAAAPLPPAGSKVAEIYEELMTRARQGDSRAACRLAADLQRCRWAPTGATLRDRRTEDWETRIAEIRDEAQRERMIRMMATIEARQEEAVQMCEGLTRDQVDQAFALQMQAAAARPELRVHAALAPALDRMFPAGELDRWQQYRQTAQPWLEQAAAAGDLAAIIALARVHGDDRRPGPPVPPYRDLDDARFVTYATLLERYGMQIAPVARAAEAARGRLDAAAVRRAEAQADALYRPEVSFDPAQRDAAMRQSMPAPTDAPRCD
jgi:hypothetical protein